MEHEVEKNHIDQFHFGRFLTVIDLHVQHEVVETGLGG